MDPTYDEIESDREKLKAALLAAGRDPVITERVTDPHKEPPNTDPHVEIPKKVYRFGEADPVYLKEDFYHVNSNGEKLSHNDLLMHWNEYRDPEDVDGFTHHDDWFDPNDPWHEQYYQSLKHHPDADLWNTVDAYLCERREAVRKATDDADSQDTMKLSHECRVLEKLLDDAIATYSYGLTESYEPTQGELKYHLEAIADDENIRWSEFPDFALGHSSIAEVKVKQQDEALEYLADHPDAMREAIEAQKQARPLATFHTAALDDLIYGVSAEYEPTIDDKNSCIQKPIEGK